MSNPVWCEVCGIHPVMFNERRCEDCWASDQAVSDRRKGASVNTLVRSNWGTNDVVVPSTTRGHRPTRAG